MTVVAAMLTPGTSFAASDPTVAAYVESPTGGDLGRAEYYRTGSALSAYATADHTQINLDGGSQTTGFGISIYAPQGQQLSTGTFPTGSTSAGWIATIYRQGGVTCSDFGGAITVTDVGWAGDGSLDVLDADISYACAGKPLTRAAVRFHSSRAIEGIHTTLPTEDVVAGVATALSDLTYQNLGTTPVTVSGVTLTADDTASSATPLSEWAVLGESCTSAPIPSGGTCSVHLQVQPTATGARRVVVSFADSSPQGVHDRLVSVKAKSKPDAPQSVVTYLYRDHVSLQWWQPSNTDPGTAADGVRVLRGATPGTMTVIADLSSTSYYDDPDVTEGVRYYQVERYNVAGSSPSDARRMEIGKGSVTNLAVVRLARHLVVRWDAPTSKYVAAQLTSYSLYLGTTSTNLTLAATLPYSNGPSYYRIPSLKPGDKRYAKVIAQYGSNNPGPASPVVGGTASASQITYVQASSRGCCIFEIGSNGGPAIPVPFSSTLSYIGQLVASPDGRKIVFTATDEQGGLTGIYQLVIGTTYATKLSPNNLLAPRDPAWSRDGRTIAFTAGGYQQDPHLYLLNVSARTASVVPNSAGLEQPVFLSATTLAAHRYSVPAAELIKISTAGARSAFPGTAHAQHASVSPDGKKMAYTSVQDGEHDILKVMTLGGSTSTPVQPFGLLSTPTWSPDSASLYVSARNGSGLIKGELYRVNLVAKTVTTLTATPDLVEHAPAFNQPDYTPPTVKITSPAVASTTATTVKVAWSATDLQAGLLSSDVRYRRALGSGALSGYVSPSGWSGTTATYKSMPVARGYRYCFSARARDRDATVSAWTAERCIRIT